MPTTSPTKSEISLAAAEPSRAFAERRTAETETQLDEAARQDADIERRVAEAEARLAEEARLRVTAERRLSEAEGRAAEEARRRAEVEERLAKAEERATGQGTALRNLRAQVALVEEECESLRRERDILLSSLVWRLTGPARRLASSLPPPLRRYVRSAARAAYWVATPHRTRERMAYLLSRRQNTEAPLAINGPIWGRPTDVEIRCVKEPSFDSEAAIIVTYSPDGWLKPHVPHYIQSLRREGIAPVLVVNTNEACKFDNADLLSYVDGLFIRQNRGYDFAAWAHIIQLHRELLDATILYLINDSIIGPFDRTAFSKLVQRIRSSEADVIGLTESIDRGWHLQSFFLAFKRKALQSTTFVNFFENVVCYVQKRDVISAYELRLAAVLKRAGLGCEPMFRAINGDNTATLHWRQLIDLGFPFMKAELLRRVIPGVNPADCLRLLSNKGWF